MKKIKIIKTERKPTDGRLKANRGGELARRLNQQTVLEQMPKVYFVEDLGGRYRVGRTDWPGDAFNLVSEKDFEIFRKVYQELNMPLLDLTNED